MKNLKPWTVLALVFVAGILVGVGGTRLAIQRIIARVSNDPSLVQVKIEHDLARGLKLTPDQRVKVHAIVERSQGDLRELRTQFRPRLGQILKRSERDIRSLLDEKQQERFERLLQRRPIVPPALNAAQQ